MAALVFPTNPAGQTPVNTFSPTSSPVQNLSNSFTYVWNSTLGVWEGQAGASAPSIPSGTRMTFQQSAAPTGWVQDVTYNNYAMRIVNGAVGTGGTVGFTTAFASGLSAAAFTLTTTEMPNHNHAARIMTTTGGVGGQSCPDFGQGFTLAPPLNQATGGSGSHAHSLPSFDVQYVDFIIATKS